MVNVGQELLNVPFGEMIVEMALGIAEAQAALDKNAVEITKFLATTTIHLPKITSEKITIDADGNLPETQRNEFPLIALGFYPPFYHFVESIIEVKMAITMVRTREIKVEAGQKVERKARLRVFSASVNASYSSRYEYKVEGSSLLRTKLVPVPPPSGLQKYVEALIKAQSKDLEEATTTTPP